MSIQRQYSLPNCTLMLEGWGNDLPLAGASTTRPVLSILTSATCLFAGHEKPLTGGREFFESLIACANQYAQEFLSGVPHGALSDRAQASVEIAPLSANLHRLTVRPQSFKDDPIKKTNAVPLELELSTVHLFDLVEAIDQFYADTQTLPELSPNLAPAPKRNVVAKEPVAQRLLPAVLGVSGLAAAAIAFFFIPVPRAPEPEASQPDAAEVSAAPSAETPASPPSASASESDPEADVIPNAEQVDTLLNTAPELRDPILLNTLATNLDDTITESWGQEYSFTNPLVYRVGVAENGDILGFKPIDDTALTSVRETPLLDLLYVPVDSELPTTEPIGQFQVTFTPEGEVEVEPWATAATPDATPEETAAEDTSDADVSSSSNSAVELGPEITDPEELARLNGTLYAKVLDRLPQDEDDFGDQWDSDLVYKVHFTPGGDVVAIEPSDEAAEEQQDYLGLSELIVQDESLSGRDQGEFMVVITDDGILQVSPWDGFQ